MSQRLLVALDDSPRAPKVFRRAAEIARGTGAELILLRVVSVPQEFPAAGAGAKKDPLREQLVRSAREDLLKDLTTETELPTRIVVVVDPSPDRAILATAEERDVDLIVIGNHGYHGLDRVLGTTAERVLRGAKRDVLIVYRGTAPL